MKYARLVVLAGLISLACTTKVSEWVLLNSEPDRYALVYVHAGTVSETARQQNATLLASLKSANIQFRSVVRQEAGTPYYALYYKNRLFSKYTDYRDLDKLAFSPLRENIAGELMAGKLCVLLYLKSDIKEKDEAALRVIKQTVTSSPFGKIMPLIELSRSNRDEAHFVSMLLNVESDLKEIREPMLFGIFGRFTALEPLLAKGISAENINLMTDFLTADCSCLIKDNLPGVNILYKGNWENPAPALVNAILDANPALLHR
jgi:hypothetical protein